VNWGKIYTECRPAMIEAAAQRVHERPDLDAADVVQEVFVAVLRDPPGEEHDLAELLVTLTVRLCMGAVEPLSGRYPFLELDDLDEEIEEDAAATAVRRVVAAEVRHRILGVMNYMTERQREITRLRLFEGMSVGEIAARVNTSSSNVSQIVIRCLAKLAPILTQCDSFDQHDLERVRPPRRVYQPAAM
jgi:RNA polymerase sigma factor (sigma-70 family)